MPMNADIFDVVAAWLSAEKVLADTKRILNELPRGQVELEEEWVMVPADCPLELISRSVHRHEIDMGAAPWRRKRMLENPIVAGRRLSIWAAMG